MKAIKIRKAALMGTIQRLECVVSLVPSQMRPEY